MHVNDFGVYGLPGLKGEPAGEPLAGEPASPTPFISECLLDTLSIYIYLQRALPLKCHYRCRVHSLIATSKMARWMGMQSGWGGSRGDVGGDNLCAGTP